MEKQQRISQKVKLRLVQPAIKCSGRAEVGCTYRGKIVKEYVDTMLINIKSYGQVVRLEYDKHTKHFSDLDDPLSNQWADLVLIK